MRQTSIAVIGAGITGVTTAYEFLQHGYDVTLIDRHLHPSLETSYANGGQLSASNAEVWNSWSTVIKGLRWMFQAQAPLLLNPAFSLHKYSWLAQFVAGIRNHKSNTIETVRMALAARRHLFEIAEREGIEFELQKRGILHLYNDKASFDTATTGNKLLLEGGLERYPVSDAEVHAIEPSLAPSFYGGFYTPSDATGDIRLFTRGLADVCRRRGATFCFDTSISHIETRAGRVQLHAASGTDGTLRVLEADAAIVCAGVESRRLAAQLGDRLNIYPVKGYSITVGLDDIASQSAAPTVSLLDESTKIVTSRLGRYRFRVAGTAEFNGYNRDIRMDRIEPLTRWCRRLFPGMSTATVVPWAGLRPMTPNMMPYVGPSRRAGVYYNTGHGHLGWTLSAETSSMIALLVTQTLRGPLQVAV